METTELAYVPCAWHEQLPAGHQHRDIADVCVNGEDDVFLYTRYDCEVLVYRRDGRFVRAWGKGVFTNAHGITMAPDGTVYCADNRDHTVRRFTQDGELLMTLGTPNEPSATGYDGRNVDSITCGAGPFNSCTKVALAASGEVYVSDGYGNARVHRFSPRGELVQSWGTPGRGPGEFRLPHGVCVLADGRVAVADRENSRVQFFSPDGEFLDAWTDLRRPTSVQTDAEGLIYVAELGARENPQDESGRMSIFGPDGTLRGRWGAYGTGPGEFIAAHGLAIDSHGDVYVSEVTWTLYGQRGLAPAGYRQIQKFTRAR